MMFECLLVLLLHPKVDGFAALPVDGQLLRRQGTSMQLNFEVGLKKLAKQKMITLPTQFVYSVEADSCTEIEFEE